jgi:hypothetical protein
MLMLDMPVVLISLPMASFFALAMLMESFGFGIGDLQKIIELLMLMIKSVLMLNGTQLNLVKWLLVLGMELLNYGIDRLIN